jgi:hypothetical protein
MSESRENLTKEEEYIEKYERIIEKLDSDRLKYKGLITEERKEEKETHSTIKNESSETSFKINLPFSIKDI